MAVENPNRLSAVGPVDPIHGFPQWFQDASGLKLELVTSPDPQAPAAGELPSPTQPVQFPGNFPDEALYFMAEARLEAGGAGQAGRARVIMALEAAFSGDGLPKADLGVVFARLRVRVDDLSPGTECVVRHPYGETRPLAADGRGRIAYTCDLGLAEGNMTRVLVTGQIAPFLAWTNGAAPGYIGDGVTDHQVTNGPFRNHVEIEGTGIGIGSADAVGPNLIRKDLFTVQGRVAGTGSPAVPPPVGVAALEIVEAEYRAGGQQYRVRGNVNPVTVPGPGGAIADRVDVTLDGAVLGSAFPDATGAWSLRKEVPDVAAPVAGAPQIVVATTLSGKVTQLGLTIRN